MTTTYDVGGRDPLIRRQEYDETTIIAVDLGANAADARVDVVDGTAIVVPDRTNQLEQFEIELPDDEAEVFIRNGILTIEVSA